MVVTVKSSHGPVPSTLKNKGKGKAPQPVHAEIPLGKYLASTEKPIRDKAVKSLAAFLANGSQDPQQSHPLLDESEMDKLWKGIFYCFWMSDKPLVQQALAAELSELILSIPHSTVASSSSSSSSSTSKKSSKRRKSEPEHSVSSTTTEVSISNRAKIGLAFVNGFWKAMIREWSMLDKYRLDKFYLLMRRFLNASFRFLATENWNSEAVKLFGDNLISGVLSPNNIQLPSSITYHVSDIYLDELEKALTASTSSSSTSEVSNLSSRLPLIELLQPFINFTTTTAAKITFERVWKNVFGEFWTESSGILESLEKFEEAGEEGTEGKKKKRKGKDGEIIEVQGDEIQKDEKVSNLLEKISDHKEIFLALTSGEGSRSQLLKTFRKELLKELFSMASRKEANEARRRNVYQFWREEGGDEEEEE